MQTGSRKVAITNQRVIVPAIETSHSKLQREKRRKKGREINLNEIIINEIERDEGKFHVKATSPMKENRTSGGSMIPIPIHLFL
jgi:hypothetical protein